jgi:N-acetylmuramoyl-L-alanine amidase
LTEAEVNQNIATLVQKQLIEKGFDVDLLKEFDPHLTNYQAAALVSIHADSCNYVNDQATGFKVAAALASPDPEKATRLTACLRARYTQATGLPLHSTSVTADMTDYHAFGEINKTTTAAIIETGFLNLDRQFLTEKPNLAAQGIVNGILCFINDENITPYTP